MFTRPNRRRHACVTPFHVRPLQLELRPASVTTALCVGHRKESEGKESRSNYPQVMLIVPFRLK